MKKYWVVPVIGIQPLSVTVWYHFDVMGIPGTRQIIAAQDLEANLLSCKKEIVPMKISERNIV
jgi:hypothetical protein